MMYARVAAVADPDGNEHRHRAGNRDLESVETGLLPGRFLQGSYRIYSFYVFTDCEVSFQSHKVHLV